MLNYGKISLIIPAYFATQQLRDMTFKCIDSIQEDVQIILVADNQPYTVNVNNAFKACTGDIIIIGNNDLVFPKKWLTELLMPLDKGYDIATCWTSDQKYKLEDNIEDNAKFGSIFAMKRSVYETVGNFDEQFKGYFSDLDYRQRVLDAGFTIGRNLNLVIEHKAKATYNVTDKEDTEFIRSQLLYESKWGFVE